MFGGDEKHKMLVRKPQSKGPLEKSRHKM